MVKKGQLLATLDNATYQNTYAMMQATQQQAEDAYDRLTPMHKNGNLPDVKYVEVETGVQKAKAAAAIAKKTLDDCKLYATTDGYIGRRSIEPGMTAMPNLTSITIVKIAFCPFWIREISSSATATRANTLSIFTIVIEVRFGIAVIPGSMDRLPI